MSRFDLCAVGRCKCAGRPEVSRCYKCEVGLPHPFHDDGTRADTPPGMMRPAWRNGQWEYGPDELRLGQDD